MGFFETIKLLLWVVFIDCVGVGLLIATLMWFISNKYLVKRQSRDYDVEWGYAFDVHLNAFYPLLVILHFIQLFFINHVILTDTFIGYLVGNTLWLIAVGYYIYVTFLGYSALDEKEATQRGTESSVVLAINSIILPIQNHCHF
ncbi:PREDICTED: protein unc-50 homolog isoform X2 [Galeopterus variegatus]|uniref:Protein unc-50 homolog isoform X2 n=1 Tax=Galeopterus variegatus TaxID=482537 RepID=A0ABM0S1T2_GALVR|nr:PREDICTED: protein unc-50 homolog isoform X2 [Galeopterus variegatus]